MACLGIIFRFIWSQIIKLVSSIGKYKAWNLFTGCWQDQFLLMRWCMHGSDSKVKHMNTHTHIHTHGYCITMPLLYAAIPVSDTTTHNSWVPILHYLFHVANGLLWQVILILVPRSRKVSAKCWHTCGWTPRCILCLVIFPRHPPPRPHPPHPRPLPHRQRRGKDLTLRRNLVSFSSTRSSPIRPRLTVKGSEKGTRQYSSMVSREHLTISGWQEPFHVDLQREYWSISICIISLPSHEKQYFWPFIVIVA